MIIPPNFLVKTIPLYSGGDELTIEYDMNNIYRIRLVE